MPPLCKGSHATSSGQARIAQQACPTIIGYEAHPLGASHARDHLVLLQAHHGYLFANARANRMKLLVHEGFGVWCAARRLNEGRFAWPREVSADAAPLVLSKEQFDALVLGLPWQRLQQHQVITRM
jgi:transposase